MSTKTRREYMEFALPGKPLKSSNLLAPAAAGARARRQACRGPSAAPFGQFYGCPNFDFVDDFRQFRVLDPLPALGKQLREMLEPLRRDFPEYECQT